MTTEIAQSPIAEYRPTEAALAELRKKYEAVVYDVTDNKTMALAKAARKELRDVRVALESERVRIKAPSLQRSRDIDSEAKRITAELEALEEPIDAQIKAEEGRKQREKDEAERIERERVEAINARFSDLKAMAVITSDATSEQIEAQIRHAENVLSLGIPDDLKAAWTHEQRLAVSSLRASLDRRMLYEAEQVELQRLRAEAAAVTAERDRLAEVERQRLADEAARLKSADDMARAEKAAQDAVAAAERAAEKAKLDQAAAVKAAEERATRQAEERERMRRDEEDRQAEAERIAAEKRAANKRRQANVNNAAMQAFIDGGLSAEQAKEVVILIASDRIPCVTINY